MYQPAVDLCIEKLKLGDWVHVFPEGKVNMTKEFIRLKWGVGRMLYECMKAKDQTMPIIIPIWHEGMDILLPNYPPYYFRLGQHLTFNVGNPIDLKDFIKRLIDDNVDEITARKLITDEIQNELMVSAFLFHIKNRYSILMIFQKLKEETVKLHEQHINT